ncbi:unnamed protein product [Callosobruchus maculatus]|uniref:Uncharacterized protein n=1 Tax=Callosobruchus maculatus TaxID=64391 RepID=A0A653CR04_CALMS|nr:unnamed protein product [Callosobruchus maculatus]
MQMSSRTKKIMGMVEQQSSCGSAVDLIDYIVEENGVLSPISEMAEDEIQNIANNIISPNENEDSNISGTHHSHDSRDSLVNGDNSSEGRNESVSDSILNNIKTRRGRRGLPYQGKQKNQETSCYNVNRPGKYVPNPCNCELSPSMSKNDRR